MKSRFAKVYAVEHKGKVIYVGTTFLSLNLRMSNHFRDCRKSGNKFAVFLRKNPVLIVRELEICDGSLRYQREKLYIEKFGTILNGYNSESSDFPGRPKGCENPSGKDHYLYGKPACKAAVKASVKARKGKSLSKEHKAKIAKGGKKNAIRVLHVQTGKIFESGKAAAENFGCDPMMISLACNGKIACKRGKLKGVTLKYID